MNTDCLHDSRWTDAKPVRGVSGMWVPVACTKCGDKAHRHRGMLGCVMGWMWRVCAFR